MSGERLRILGAARTLPMHSIGGMQTIAWDLFREFARLGHRVTVLTTRIADAAAEETVVDGVRVVPLQGTTPERCNSAWWRGSARWYAARRQDFDAVLGISSAAAALARQRDAVPAVPFVFQAHGTSWGEIASKWSTARPTQWLKSLRNVYWLFKDAVVYRRFDHVVLVGDVLARQFATAPVAWYARGVSTRVIRNGVDTTRFAPDPPARAAARARLGWQEHERACAFAARMHPQKGGDVALRAFAQLPDRDRLRMLMIGGGADLPRLQRLAQQLGCAGRVLFTGAVERAQMPDLLRACDAFAFPSLRREGLPMNVLEALACGLRPVCSTSMRGVFDAALPITYAPPEDVGAFSTALGTALREGPAHTSLLSPDYTLAHCAQAYLDLLREPTRRA